MSNETPHGEIHKLIPKMIGQCPVVEKKGYNKAQNYYFTRIVDILVAVKKVLALNGVSVIPVKVEKEHERFQYINKYGKESQMNHCRVLVEYHWISDKDGSVQICSVPGEGQDMGDKAYNKAMTSARKTAYCQVLMIASEEDDSENEGAADDDKHPTRQDSKQLQQQQEEKKADEQKPPKDAPKRYDVPEMEILRTYSPKSEDDKKQLNAMYKSAQYYDDKAGLERITTLSKEWKEA